MPIAVIFLHSFYIAISYLGGASCNGPTLAEIRDRFKGNIYFLEIAMFLGQKNRQNRDRFKVKTFFRDTVFFKKKLTKLRQIQSCKFLFHYLIKCRFDQMSFRSSVVLIKCHFDQMSFRSSVVSIKYRFDLMSFRSSVLRLTVGSRFPAN